jgi:hypothetical protein
MRYREKPIHPFVQKLMDQYKAEHPHELAEKTKIPLTTILGWADFDNERSKSQFRSLYENSRKLGMTVDQFLEGMLSIDMFEESDQE